MEGEGKMSPAFNLEGEGVRRLLKEIEERYSDAFAEIGPGALQRFKHLIDEVEAFLDLLEDLKGEVLDQIDRLRQDQGRRSRVLLVLYEVVREAHRRRG